MHGVIGGLQICVWLPVPFPFLWIRKPADFSLVTGARRAVKRFGTDRVPAGCNSYKYVARSPRNLVKEFSL